MKEIGLKKEFRELTTLEARINLVKESIQNPNDYDLDLVYKELANIAQLLDYLSGHEYGFILQQLEQVCKGKKANLLTAWVKYITSLLDLTRDCLALKGLDNMSSV